jgi:hypothetical protein
MAAFYAAGVGGLLFEEVADEQESTLPNEGSSDVKDAVKVDILKTFAELHHIVFFGGLNVFEFAFENFAGFAEKLLDELVLIFGRTDAVDFIAQVDEPFREGAGAAADIENRFYLCGDVRDYKFAIFVLGDVEIENFRFETFFPQAVVQMVEFEQAFADDVTDFEAYFARYVLFAFLHPAPSFYSFLFKMTISLFINRL